MKIILTQLILFFTICAHAQQPLDFGNVIADSNFNCGNNVRNDSVYFGIKSICNSKSQMEIRLYLVSLPSGHTSQLIILSYDGADWRAKKYVTKNSGIGIEHSYSTYEPFDGAPKSLNDMPYKNLFDTLKANNIFSLPDQSELKYEPFVHDGVAFRITFKVNNSFRAYSFGNPESYAEAYPDIKEFKEYVTIAKYMLAFFGK